MKALLRLLAFLAAVGLVVYGLASGSEVTWLGMLYLAVLPLGYVLFSLVPRETVGWRRGTWKIAAALSLGFVLLSLQLLRQQFIVAPALAERPVQTAVGQIINPRVLNSELRVQRGRIFDRSGVEIAGRVVTPTGLVRRTYPEPAAANLVGYYSPTVFGRSGLELAFDDYLAGRKGDPIGEFRNRMLHQALVGSDVYLTLDARLQRLGQKLLGNRRGAVVVLQPRTGEVLAMVSGPSFDPALLTPDPTKSASEEATRIRTEWNRILNAGDSRLLNRAAQGLYSPGSTFKTITAAAAIDTGTARPEDVYQDPGRFVVQGHVIRDPNRPDPTKVNWTLADGYAYSLNAVFAQVGLQVGTAGIREYGRRLYYERDIPFDLPVRRSQLASSTAFLDNPVALADTAIGQGQLLSTPLEVALTTAAIANGGVMPEPYLVSGVRTAGGLNVYTRGYRPLTTAVRPETAAALTQMMIRTVQVGSGTTAQIPGIQVAGKTGTAQLGAGLPHAWFTAFAPANDPKVAVAVLVENGGEGYSVAAPIARDMIRAALQGK